MNKYLGFIGVGFELIGLIVLSVYLGEYLESIKPSKGLWVSGLIIISLLGWFLHLLYMIKVAQKGKQ